MPVKRGDMKIHNPFDKDNQSHRIVDPFEGNEGGLGQNMAMDQIDRAKAVNRGTTDETSHPGQMKMDGSSG